MFIYKLLYTAILVLVWSVSIQTTSNSSNIVTLPNGNKLAGIFQTSFYRKREYVEFRGIPYAKAPLRFQPTVLFDESWGSETKDASEFGSICPQLDPWYDPDEEEEGSWEELRVIGTEDCLFTNVATPSIEADSLYPVLVWFHGGNFQTESGQDYGPSKLLDHDIIVVTFNYRLGPFGFLNSEDGNVNGNMGLKDQSIVLQWVKKNIKSFKGDPDQVTVAGTNSGAVSVHLHMLSDMSQGLFRRAIIQSGTAISPWVPMKEGSERAKKLIKHLKCSNDTDEFTCLSMTDANVIIQRMPKMAEWYLDPLVPFGPSVEIFGPTQERFLSKNPYSILAEKNYWAKHIPVIMGVNSHEGLLHAMDIGHQGMLRHVFNREWYGAAPISLYYKKSAIDPHSVSEAIRTFYFPKEQNEDGTDVIRLVDKDYLFNNLTNLYSDRHFFVPLHHSAMLMGKHNDLYVYWFDYVSDQTIHGLFGYNNSNIYGASHYDQLQYLFVTTFFNETKEDHIVFEKTFIKQFCKFVKDGSPFRNDWIQVTPEMTEGSVPLLFNRIGKVADAPNLIEPFINRLEFWNRQLLMEYNRGSVIDQLVDEQDSNSQKDEL